MSRICLTGPVVPDKSSLYANLLVLPQCLYLAQSLFLSIATAIGRITIVLGWPQPDRANLSFAPAGQPLPVWQKNIFIAKTVPYISGFDFVVQNLSAFVCDNMQPAFVALRSIGALSFFYFSRTPNWRFKDFIRLSTRFCTLFKHSERKGRNEN